MNVFIIGIIGRTGSRVAHALSVRGDKVCGLYRRPEQLLSIQGLGASGALGDVATISEKELASAISGADALVFTAGAGDNDEDSMIDSVDRDGVRKTIAAARTAGVSRLLLVSAFPEAWRETYAQEL